MTPKCDVFIARVDENSVEFNTSLKLRDWVTTPQIYSILINRGSYVMYYNLCYALMDIFEELFGKKDLVIYYPTELDDKVKARLY